MIGGWQSNGADRFWLLGVPFLWPVWAGQGDQSHPTVEACFMELRSLLVGAPQGDFRNSKRSEALIGQMSVFGLHLSILLTFFSGLHITYNSY